MGTVDLGTSNLQAQCNNTIHIGPCGVLHSHGIFLCIYSVSHGTTPTKDLLQYSVCTSLALVEGEVQQSEFRLRCLATRIVACRAITELSLCSTVGSVKYTYYQFAIAEVHRTGNEKKKLFS